jgi:Ca2+-binding EF-hand superfamily protein/thiol-disulfide isomerase/thioredoxin
MKIKSMPKNARLDGRIFVKRESWDAPTTESIDNLTAELLDRYSTTFNEADTDKDGLLHRDELRTILERVGSGNEHTQLHWMTDDDLDQIFDQYDRDRDNAINLTEFMTLAHDNVFLTKALSEYRTAFNAVDQNKDGFLGPTELLSLLSKVDSPLQSYENIVRLMNKYDTDRNGRMDFGEFLRMARYEQALPLEEILTYAAGGNIKTSLSTPVSSSSASSSSVGREMHDKNTGYTTTTTTTTTALSSTNLTASISLASESSTPPTTSSSSSLKPAGGAAARLAKQRAKNEQLVTSIANEESLNGIFESNKDKVLVVMGSLSWCRPCKRMIPVFHRMAEAYPHVVFLHLNGNDNEETKHLFKHTLKMRATPAFLFFKQGAVVDMCSGANPARFESHLRNLLKEDEMPRKSLYELIDITPEKEEEENGKIQA